MSVFGQRGTHSTSASIASALGKNSNQNSIGQRKIHQGHSIATGGPRSTTQGDSAHDSVQSSEIRSPTFGGLPETTLEGSNKKTVNSITGGMSRGPRTTFQNNREFGSDAVGSEAGPKQPAVSSNPSSQQPATTSRSAFSGFGGRAKGRAAHMASALGSLAQRGVQKVHSPGAGKG